MFIKSRYFFNSRTIHKLKQVKNMEDVFKKFLYTGLGLAALTVEQVQKGVDELVSNKKISKEEGKKIVEDVVQKTTSKKEELEGQFKKLADEVMERLNFSRSKEIEELKKRVAVLEAQINKSATAQKPFKAAPDKASAYTQTKKP